MLTNIIHLDSFRNSEQIYKDARATLLLENCTDLVTPSNFFLFSIKPLPRNAQQHTFTEQDLSDLSLTDAQNTLNEYEYLEYLLNKMKNKSLLSPDTLEKVHQSFCYITGNHSFCDASKVHLALSKFWEQKYHYVYMFKECSNITDDEINFDIAQLHCTYRFLTLEDLDRAYSEYINAYSKEVVPFILSKESFAQIIKSKELILFTDLDGNWAGIVRGTITKDELYGDYGLKCTSPNKVQFLSQLFVFKSLQHVHEQKLNRYSLHVEQNNPIKNIYIISDFETDPILDSYIFIPNKKIKS